MPHDPAQLLQAIRDNNAAATPKSAAELADRLGVHRNVVYRMARRHNLKPGGKAHGPRIGELDVKSQTSSRIKFVWIGSKLLRSAGFDGADTLHYHIEPGKLVITLPAKED